MLKEKSNNNYLIIVLILFGSILRLSVFWVSPPNNAYDDHLQVISIYAKDSKRPAPFQCWECYQPPLYYSISAVVYNTAKKIGLSHSNCWKVVQGINPVLSIIILIIGYQILLLSNLKRQSVAIIISFLVILPRDIFTSAMIGNDYLLTFFSVIALYIFCKNLDALREKKKILFWFVALVFVSLLGSLSKQHGLLLFLLPGVIFLFLCKKENRKILNRAIPILLIGLALSTCEEFWKYNKTGKFLVSNQHYFDYAKNQFPGSLEKVEFFTFRILNLYKEPSISNDTSASFFTELFARTFYDYEWRFISPKIPWEVILGRIGYTVGLIWIFYYLLIFLSWAKKNNWSFLKNNLYTLSYKFAPVLLAFLFFTVPLLQTLRYPYFSSMKSMFMLPGIIIFLLIIGSLLNEKSFAQRLGPYIIAINISYGALLVISIWTYIGISINHLHGPLWPIP